MMTMALLAAAPILDAYWHAILACPQVAAGDSVGTGVVVGVKDGFAYLLTANHVVANANRVDVQFTSRANYPKPAWFAKEAAVLARWPDADLALVRFPTEKREIPVLPLAPAWQRPKTFPVAARSIGAGIGEASAARAETITAREFIKRPGREGAFFWVLKDPTQRGSSGGPVLDKSNRVIGITVATARERGFAIHHDEILAALIRDGHGWLIPDP